MSPLVALAGFASAVPLDRDQAASIASLTETAVAEIGLGIGAGPRPAAHRRRRAPPAGRTGRRGCRSPRRACRAPAADPDRRAGRRSPPSSPGSRAAAAFRAARLRPSRRRSPLPDGRSRGPHLGDRDRGRGRAGAGAGRRAASAPASGSGSATVTGRRSASGGGLAGSLGSGVGLGARRRSRRRDAAGRRRARRPASRGGDSRRRRSRCCPAGPAVRPRLDDVAGPDGRAGQCSSRGHDPERTGPVVDRDPEPVGQGRRRFHDRPRSRRVECPRGSRRPRPWSPRADPAAGRARRPRDGVLGVEDPQAEVAAEGARDGHDRARPEPAGSRAAARRTAIPPVASWTNPIRPESIAPRSRSSARPRP